MIWENKLNCTIILKFCVDCKLKGIGGSFSNYVLCCVSLDSNSIELGRRQDWSEWEGRSWRCCAWDGSTACLLEYDIHTAVIRTDDPLRICDSGDYYSDSSSFSALRASTPLRNRSGYDIVCNCINARSCSGIKWTAFRHGTGSSTCWCPDY